MMFKLRAFLDLVFFAGSIFVGFLKWDGNSIDEVASKYPVIITPAIFSFGIWIVIFVGVILVILWELLLAGKSNPIANGITIWLILASLFQAAWEITWCYSIIWLSIWAEFLLTTCLFYLNLNMMIAVIKERDANRSDKKPKENHNIKYHRWLQFPFSLWLGWALFILFVQLSIVHNYLLHWKWFNGDMWALIAIILLATCALFWTLRSSSDLGFPIAITWGLLGIASDQIKYNVPFISSITGATIIFFAMIVSTIFRYRKKCSRWIAKFRNEEAHTESSERLLGSMDASIIPSAPLEAPWTTSSPAPIMKVDSSAPITTEPLRRTMEPTGSLPISIFPGNISESNAYNTQHLSLPVPIAMWTQQQMQPQTSPLFLLNSTTEQPQTPIQILVLQNQPQ